MNHFIARLSARAAVIGVLATTLGVAWISASAHDGDRRKDWVGTWAASQQTLEPPFIAANPAQFSNQTIRQIVPLSIGGQTLRLRLSNEFGRTPLRVGEVRVAQQLAGASILPGSDRVVTFGDSQRRGSRASSAALSRTVRTQATETGILPIRACHSLGPVLCTLVPNASTATVTGMSTTSNS